MEREIVIGMLKVLVKYNIIPARYLREQEIKKDYKDLLSDGLPGGKAKQKLSEKYCMSYKNVEVILYKKKKNNKKEPFNNNNSAPGGDNPTEL